ncbi:unnamed protein product [Hyaloperonospora brassicae]|uniref:subtilisin n=1 Tax=Hyaloperonospora brassicae TaxID=162125 RepID=A0AAV0TAG1_HYABA|nr:unnamed protein product [Hyaloperonospora brassicae]
MGGTRRSLVAAVVGAALLSVPLLSSANAKALVDARGLQFVSRDAFCAYHCSRAHVHQVYRHLRAQSECLEAVCPAYFDDRGAPTAPPSAVRRRLRPSVAFPRSTDDRSSALDEAAVVADVHAATEDGKNVTIISVVSCASVTDITLSIGDPEQDEFAGFYTAFSTAYDAMLAGANATFDACQLQFLQKELLATYATADLVDAADVMEIKPSLIKLHVARDELACVQAIKSIWPATSESHTPFLTRSDQTTAAATVLLVHVSAAVGDAILALPCVESVTVLPPILKLMPFAKSSYALSRDTAKSREGPALEIRLAKGAATDRALGRLATRVTRATGIENVITRQRGTADTGGVLLQAALDDYTTWTQVVALVLDDEAVEWVDLRPVVTTSAVHGLLPDATGLAAATGRTGRRRLDDYAQDVMGVDVMRAHNITGSDIVVGITDTGLYIDHDQFDQASRAMYDRADPSARKVLYYQTFANDVDEAEGVTCGHGTHVAGILAGSSYSHLHADMGIAPSARIAFMDIGNQDAACAGTNGCKVSLETPGEVADLMNAQVDMGARIFSFSWGTGANDYNTQTAQVDEYIYDHPEILIVVAAGNSGEKGRHTISSPSGAKNVISVGASLNAAASFAATPCASVLNEHTVASFSSIGPTLDGRLKPDLVAPGMSMTSSQSEPPGQKLKSSAVCPLQGTSQAAPVIAGMAVLIYEWLRDGWWKNGVKDAAFGMKTIPASLLKALLLHSSEAMARRLIEPTADVTSCVALEAGAMALPAYPDFNQGYGKPTLLNLVSFLGQDDTSAASTSSSSSSSASSPPSSGTTSSNSIYFFPNSSTGSEPSVLEGSEVTFHFMLTTGVNLRVTLVWTDPPGSVGSKATLQNDLDLTLKVANTSTRFDPLSGNGSRDAVNNVEMVEVSYDAVFAAVTAAGMDVDPDGSIYVQAVVSGYSVKAGANATTTGQKFSIVASSTPSATSVTFLDPTHGAFWQPWMVIGAIIVSTLVVLLVIAAAWRTHVTRCAHRSLKTAAARGATAMPRTGATGALFGHKGLSRRDQKLRANGEAFTPVPVPLCPTAGDYCNVPTAGAMQQQRPIIETAIRGADDRSSRRRTDFDPSAVGVRAPSRRAATATTATSTITSTITTSGRTNALASVEKPPRLMSARQGNYAHEAIHLEPPKPSSRRQDEFSGVKREESDGTLRRIESRRERPKSERSGDGASDRERVRSARKNASVKTSATPPPSSSRRNRLSSQDL